MIAPGIIRRSEGDVPIPLFSLDSETSRLDATSEDEGGLMVTCDEPPLKRVSAPGLQVWGYDKCVVM